jgi:hypothetical protein
MKSEILWTFRSAPWMGDRPVSMPVPIKDNATKDMRDKIPRSKCSLSLRLHNNQ